MNTIFCCWQWCVKITLFFVENCSVADLDLGWVKNRIRDKHPGSATLEKYQFGGVIKYSIRFQPKYRPLRSVLWIRIRIRIIL